MLGQKEVKNMLSERVWHVEKDVVKIFTGLKNYWGCQKFKLEFTKEGVDVGRGNWISRPKGCYRILV